MYDVIVVGGGIVGSALAYHLVQANVRTLLLDRLDAGRATDAGAGIIAVAHDEPFDPVTEFMAAAAAFYPLLIAELNAADTGPTGYAVCGELTVAVSPDEYRPYQELRQALLGRRGARSKAGRAIVELETREAQALFPPLEAVPSALYDPRVARVDGRLLATALQQAAVARGLERKHASVEQLDVQQNRVTGVVVAGELIRTEAVAIAGGAWTAALGRQLHTTISVTPMRGQIAHLGLPGVATSDWPIVTGLREHYLVAWPDNRVVAGATRERGAGFQPTLTAEGVREVLDEALRVAPGLAQAEVRELRVGLRPVTPDGLPALGQLSTVPNVFVATGHGPLGLTLGPYSGAMLADLMLGRSTAHDLRRFAPDRFSL